MVTHSSTSRPVQCLCMAERTGCPVLTDLWSYVAYRPELGITKIRSRGARMRVNKSGEGMTKLIRMLSWKPERGEDLTFHYR
jgi:hypothetical protein